MRAPAATWASYSGVFLRSGSDTRCSAADDPARTESDSAHAPPLSMEPERFRKGRSQSLLLRRATPEAALLSSVHQPSRSFCLSVSGAVAPSAPGIAPGLSRERSLVCA